MTTQPTPDPTDTRELDPARNVIGVWRPNRAALLHWSASVGGSWWDSARRRWGGPWGRLYGGVAVALLFTLGVRTLGGLLVIGVLVVGVAWARDTLRILYLPPILAIFARHGPAIAVGCGVALAIGVAWARRADRPDPLALRIHYRLAELTKAPTTERFFRLEYYNEARNRMLLQRGQGRGTWRRARVPDYRPLNPVPHWVRVDPAPAGGHYPIGGVFFRYPAAFADDDPDKRAKVLAALAHKLPAIGGNPPELVCPDRPKTPDDPVSPGWRTDQDWAYACPARPLPDWVTIDDLPTLPWADVVPFGLTSPDQPFAALLEDDDLAGVACWNPDNPDCPLPMTPGILLAGPPGAYKTSTLRTLIAGARTYLGAHVTAIDGKREGAFAYLATLDDCVEVTDPAQAKTEIDRLWREMKARYALNDTRRRRGEPLFRFQPRVVIIDEGMSLLDQLAGDDDIDTLMVQIVDLARLGRLGRVFLIWATQRPDVKGIAKYGTVGQLRDMLELRIAGAGLSEAGARMVFGDSNGTLATLIPKIPRARLGMMIGSMFGLVQLAYTPDPLGHHPTTPGPYVHSALAYNNPPTKPTAVPDPTDDDPHDQPPAATAPTAPIDITRRRTQTP